MKTAVMFLGPLCVVVLACSPEKATEKASDAAATVKEKVADVFDVATPVGPREDPALREKERFDTRWRRLRSFAAAQAAQAARAAQKQREVANLKFVTGAKETFKNLDVNAIAQMPINVPISGDVAGPSVLKAQVMLDRIHFSVGPIDGRWGKNSAIAIWWYQRSRGLEATGDVDEKTFRSLAAEAENPPPLQSHALTADDVKGPFVSIPEDVYEKAKLNCLCYESVAEKLAERFHTDTEFLDLLNPNVKFSDLKEGDTLIVPNVRPPVTEDRPDFARVMISIVGNSFNAFDSSGNLIFHAPTTVGSKYDPSPDETVEVKKIVRDPHFHYQPKLFADVPDTEPEANLQPGPNSPVGVVWIALSKPHFGVHGTSDPDSIGYVSSHGCVRLTNWDAEEVSHRIQPNVQISFVDTRRESETQEAE